ncbi:ATP-binding protein, partial [Actinomadura darangshiensis]
ACAWRLPGDEGGPAVARRLVQETMSRLGLGRDLIEDGKLAVSETATNAFRHGRAPGDRSTVTPELWVWARTVPSPQLVVSVFDGARTAVPREGRAGLLDEGGKGLELVRAITADWGSAATRSRVHTGAVPGKAVWFALPLGREWPGVRHTVHPGTAAQCLLLSVTRRGFVGTRNTGRDGLSVVMLPGLNVWVHPEHFCWRDGPRRYLRRPLIDLQETTEHVVRYLDSLTAPVRSSTT